MIRRAAVAAVALAAATAACSGSPSPGAARCTPPHGTLETQMVAVPGGPPLRVAVYLPPAARRSGAAYPALYLLHGARADQTQWPAIGVTGAADRLIAAGSIQPLVIVMPDIDADARAVTEGVVPWADAHLPVIPDAANRAIGGISRGGGTALRLAAARPYRFARVGGHSPAVAGNDDLAGRLAAWGGPVWLDVGSRDSLRTGVGHLNSELEGDGTVAQLHLYAGAHDRHYWRAHVEDYLRFYGGARAAPGSPGCAASRHVDGRQVDGRQVDDEAGAPQR